MWIWVEKSIKIIEVADNAISIVKYVFSFLSFYPHFPSNSKVNQKQQQPRFIQIQAH